MFNVSSQNIRLGPLFSCSILAPNETPILFSVHSSSERESKAENYSTMKFKGYLLSLHVLLIHLLESGQNFLNALKLSFVTGEHDVERGGTKLASSERESKAENYSTMKFKGYLLSLHVLLIHLLESDKIF